MYEPTVGEAFNQRRMKRCCDVASKILAERTEDKDLRYTVLSRESIAGKTLDALSRMYFSVGVEGDLTDMGFVDMLVTFSLVREQIAESTSTTGATCAPTESSSKTEFSATNAFLLLNEISIETPSVS